MRKELFNLLYLTSAILVILLSMFNLQNINKKQVKVLGIETNNSFWEEITIKHPTYRDAWVELRRMDMVKQIDPNYSQLP